MEVQCGLKLRLRRCGLSCVGGSKNERENGLNNMHRLTKALCAPRDTGHSGGGGRNFHRSFYRLNSGTGDDMGIWVESPTSAEYECGGSRLLWACRRSLGQLSTAGSDTDATSSCKPVHVGIPHWDELHRFPSPCTSHTELLLLAGFTGVYLVAVCQYLSHIIFDFQRILFDTATAPAHPRPEQASSRRDKDR